MRLLSNIPLHKLQKKLFLSKNIWPFTIYISSVRLLFTNRICYQAHTLFPSRLVELVPDLIAAIEDPEAGVSAALSQLQNLLNPRPDTQCYTLKLFLLKQVRDLHYCWLYLGIDLYSFTVLANQCFLLLSWDLYASLGVQTKRCDCPL